MHLATNTIKFQYVIPTLQNEFPGLINTHADGWESPLNHWLHEGPDEYHVWMLSQKMYRFLRWHDGKHNLLSDKTEVGWYNIPDRGFDVE